MTLKEKLDVQANRRMIAAAKGAALAAKISSGEPAIISCHAPKGVPQWEHDAFVLGLEKELIVLGWPRK